MTQHLLTEKTEIIGTSHTLYWTEDLLNCLAVAPGSEPPDTQWGLYACQREYLIPTMNRGQTVCLTYLNTTSTQQEPTIWIDILHKGVRTELRVPQPEISGVPQNLRSYSQIWCTAGWSCGGSAVLDDLVAVGELDSLDDLGELLEAA